MKARMADVYQNWLSIRYVAEEGDEEDLEGVGGMALTRERVN